MNPSHNPIPNANLPLAPCAPLNRTLALTLTLTLELTTHQHLHNLDPRLPGAQALTADNDHEFLQRCGVQSYL